MSTKSRNPFADSHASPQSLEEQPQVGVKPEIQRVTEWPGQSDGEGQCKLPSWIWYSSEGKPVKYGAEAYYQDAEEAYEQGCQLAKYFKLHLHPADMAPSTGFQLHPLPRGIQIGQVYTNYLRYLFLHTQTFFHEHVFRGQEIWQELSSSMDIIIAHPNGWGTREQGVLRTAAVQAGLTTATRYNRQISFVSEAEASVQFCLSSSRTTSSLNPGMNLVVCDAGGSTVDTTVYKVTAVEPMLELEEIKSSACIQAGAIFVDDAAEQYLREQFEDAGLDDDDVDTYTKDGLDHFTSFIKPNFNGTEETLDIKVGKRKLNLPSINVQGGRMKLTRKTVQPFFDNCVKRITDSVSLQSSGVSSPYFFLVGGFGDSPYLKTAIRNRFGVSNRLTASNIPGAKAVADGAAIWAVARSVVCRATRYSYGIEIARPYNKRNSQHTGRKKLYWPSGTYHVKGGWSQIVAKDMVISYDSSIKQPYGQEYYTLSEIPSKISVTIYATTLSADYEFMCNEDGLVYDGWSVVCKVSANLEDLGSIAVKKYSPSTGSYWVLNYNIAILFGGTQLSAYIEWVQNGRTMTGPATVIPAALK